MSFTESSDSVFKDRLTKRGFILRRVRAEPQRGCSATVSRRVGERSGNFSNRQVSSFDLRGVGAVSRRGALFSAFWVPVKNFFSAPSRFSVLSRGPGRHHRVGRPGLAPVA